MFTCINKLNEEGESCCKCVCVRRDVHRLAGIYCDKKRPPFVSIVHLTGLVGFEAAIFVSGARGTSAAMKEAEVQSVCVFILLSNNIASLIELE